MRLGLSSAAFYGRGETEDAAQRLRDFPVDLCEIFLETWSEYSAAFGRAVRERLCGLPCRSIHAKGLMFEGDLFGASQRQRQDAFKVLENVLDCGAALGAGVWVFHGPPDFRGGLAPERIRRLAESVQTACALAKERSILMAWENVSWCALKRPQEAAYLAEACPGLHFTLDIKQARQAGADPFAFLPVMGGRLAHVHVLDWDGQGRLCLPGQGSFNFPRFFQALRDMGYQGDVILEPYAAQAENETELLKSLQFLRSLLPQNG